MLEISVICNENACVCKSVTENLNCDYTLFYLEYDEVCQKYMLLRSHSCRKIVKVTWSFCLHQVVVINVTELELWSLP